MRWTCWRQALLWADNKVQHKSGYEAKDVEMLGTQKSLIQTQVEARQILGLQQHNLLVPSPYSTGRFRPKPDVAKRLRVQREPLSLASLWSISWS